MRPDVYPVWSVSHFETTYRKYCCGRVRLNDSG